MFPIHCELKVIVLNMWKKKHSANDKPNTKLTNYLNVLQFSTSNY